MSPLPNSWREDLVRLLTGVGTAPSANDWVAPTPRRSAARQVQIYRTQVHLRWMNSLRRQLAGVAIWLGDDFEQIATAYLRAHPPVDPSLYTIAEAFIAWSDREGLAAEVRSLVRLDLAVGRASRAPNSRSLAGVDASTRLRWSPSLSVLRLDRAWHSWRAESMVHGRLPEPDRAETTIAVYRRGDQVRDQVLTPMEAKLLAEFESPKPLLDALSGLDVDAEHVLPAFHRFAERGWIEPFS
jgi:hypothetical protein